MIENVALWPEEAWNPDWRNCQLVPELNSGFKPLSLCTTSSNCANYRLDQHSMIAGMLKELQRMPSELFMIHHNWNLQSYNYHPFPSMMEVPSWYQKNLNSPFWCVVQELDSQTRFQYIQDFSRAKRPLSGTTYKKGSYLIESYTHLTTNEGKIFVWEFCPWNFWPIEVKKLEKTNPIILRCKSFGAFPTFLVVFYSSCLDARCKITKISSTYFYYIAPGFDFCKQNIL